MTAQIGTGGARQGAVGTVLMVANYRPDVGFAWWLMERFWVELAALARDAGYAPAIAYPQHGEIPSAISAAGIDVVFQALPGRGLRGLARTLNLVRSRQVRMVYFTDRAYTSLTYLLLRLAGVKIIVNHDHTPGDRPRVGGIRGSLKAAWRRLHAASCDLQVCVSPLIRSRAIENARLPPDRVAVVQNGIEPLRCGERTDYAREVFGLPPDAVICMTVARANPYKRIDFVIQVARRCVIERGQQNLYFIFCGDGPDMQRLRELATEAGLAEHFVFAGRRTDVHRLLCSSHLALHPSRGEAFSLAIVEYMSAGLAVLVPSIPSVSQAVSHGETGIVYEDDNADEAAAEICRLAQSSDERARLGQAASRTVELKYSSDAMIKQFRTVLGGQVARLPHAPSRDGLC